ncbi:UNVERIFIED_CONTAM: hypothetical protein GTU68_031538 [Idotea baltica]|nr:hypothetical protein [Idotea baltica]
MSDNTTALLILEDGTVFEGKAAGKKGTATGEICFNTGMTGYQEVFTDPSYFGQIMVTTNVHIGNYGVHTEESESGDMKIAGLVCKKFVTKYSRDLADKDLKEYFVDQKMIAISDVDTRALVRHIRSKGAMNAIISSDVLDVDKLKKKLSKVPSMSGLELSSKVSTKEAYTYGNSDANLKLAVLDLGVKQNILRCFAERGCFIKVFPAKTSFEEMSKWNPNGYFISNGPGDPAAMDYAVKTIKQILDKNLPLFGICLGHQLLALACGISTYKMHNGHRGLNHPVKNLLTGKCEITSQNHGFGANMGEIKQSEIVEATHQNLNDDTIEGIRLKVFRISYKPAFSMQYHPESSPGPHDSRYLFDEFIKLVK